MGGFLRAAGEYTTALSTTLGARLRSVILHGSVARGEAVEGVSDVNLLVLVDSVDGDLLRRLAPDARRWLERERSLPLVLTWDEWAAASDVFAIETADMVDRHQVLHGDDPLDGRVVDLRDLRIQAERELRVKLIHLREGTLAAADRPADLGRLALTAMPSVATYLRTALRLAGATAPVATTETLTDGAALTSADAAPLLRLWALREQRRVPDVEADDPLMIALHDILEGTVDYVDTLPGDMQ